MKKTLPIDLLEENKGQIDGVPANPRTISKEKMEKLKKSIEADANMLSLRGVMVAPLLDGSGKFVVIGGNMRLKALKALGYKEVPCEVMDDLDDISPEERIEIIKRRLILDNAEFGDWDMDALANEWNPEDLNEWGLDLGFEENEAKEIVEDTPPSVDQAEPRSQLGDVWKLGEHRLMVGDATKEENVATLMGGVLADLVITDPPYNVDYQGKRKVREKIKNDKMEDSAFFNFLVDAYSSMDKHMKEGASFYIWYADKESYNFRGACKEIGWQIRESLVWVKNIHVLSRLDYHYKHEPCLYGWKDGKAHYFIDKRTETTVIEEELDIDKMKAQEMRDLLKEIYENTKTTVIHEKKPLTSELHPTMKPVKLIAKLVENSSKEEWIVLDVFGGSGTTLMACEQLNRKARIMELDPKYADVIIQRWEEFTGETAELIRR